MRSGNDLYWACSRRRVEMIPLPDVQPGSDPIANLQDFITANQPLLLLTGAGCSTSSGIPDYRDPNGRWKHAHPILYQDYLSNAQARKVYWSRSMLGWPRIARALPNPAHTALAALEHAGLIGFLVTQNVDGLHQKAGSSLVLELHGGLAWVVCLECHQRIPRAELQNILLQDNPGFVTAGATSAPDGDVYIGDPDVTRFRVPVCPLCCGMLKPDVVFFGEQVPGQRVELAIAALDRARALLVVGSSLMVYSGYRFCKYARQRHKPVGIINRGRTRADHEVDFKLDLPCDQVLTKVACRLRNHHYRD